MKLAAVGCIALLLVAATASAELIYIKNCTLGPDNCATYNITAGCSAIPGESDMVLLQGCKRPEKDRLCLFQQTFKTSDCSGTPSTPWTLLSRCNYCEEDYDGGTSGTQWSCNATGFWQQSCEDYACQTCIPAPWQSVECSEGVRYRVQTCPYLYYSQEFTYACEAPESNGVTPMGWAVSPVTYGNVTYSCTPF